MTPRTGHPLGRWIWLGVAAGVAVAVVAVDFFWTAVTCTPVQNGGVFADDCVDAPAVGMPAAIVVSLIGVAAIVFCLRRAAVARS